MTSDTLTVVTRPNRIPVVVKAQALQDLPTAVWVRGRNGTMKALSRSILSAGDLLLVKVRDGQPLLQQVIGKPEEEYDDIAKTVGVFANVRQPSMTALKRKLPTNTWWTEGEQLP